MVYGIYAAGQQTKKEVAWIGSGKYAEDTYIGILVFF
jgi:hypothetical protein